MTNTLNPYLNFKDNAAEAMAFYQSFLGGDLRVSKFGDMGDTSEAADLTMHAMLVTDEGFTLMASDSHPSMGEFTAPAGFSISLSGVGEERLRAYWDALVAEGTIGMPLGKQPWGDVFGHVIDKFGISWLVNIVSAENATARS
jgi:PhnB protein